MSSLLFLLKIKFIFDDDKFYMHIISNMKLIPHKFGQNRGLTYAEMLNFLFIDYVIEVT